LDAGAELALEEGAELAFEEGAELALLDLSAAATQLAPELVAEH